MQEITVVTKVYSFDELPEDIQNKVIDDNYDINVDFEWHDDTCENAEQIGVKITGFDLSHNTISGELIECPVDVKKAILKQHGKTCDTYKTVKEYDFRTEVDEGEFLRSILEDYRTMLDNEYEYLTSHEAIKETIESNEYQFTIEGEIF